MKKVEEGLNNINLTNQADQFKLIDEQEFKKQNKPKFTNAQ